MHIYFDLATIPTLHAYKKNILIFLRPTVVKSTKKYIDVHGARNKHSKIRKMILYTMKVKEMYFNYSINKIKSKKSCNNNIIRSFSSVTSRRERNA
mmetsp:Transcript_10688/g.13935  ORF Transcript_10688/g.13935 Transcript_10688/m.13935 type:complete len:96 (+) Transcript_10688:1123-1410(+)